MRSKLVDLGGHAVEALVDVWTCDGSWWSWGTHAVDIGGHGLDMRWTWVKVGWTRVDIAGHGVDMR